MHVLHDVFPAHLTVAQAGMYETVQEVRSQPPMDDAYYLSKTRIVVSPERVVVAHDGPHGPVIVFSEPYVEFHKSNVPTEDSYVVTETGKMLAYKKDVNCGCGSALRSWNPYKHVYSTKDPTE